MKNSSLECRCDVCPQAKQTRLPFPKSQSFTKASFQLLHMDVWGLYHTPKHLKEKYFLTIIDDFSRATWFIPLKQKGEVI